MLHNLLDQTATVLTPVVSGKDAYGNLTYDFVEVGDFPCRVQTYKGQEFEVDRDTRRTWFKIFLPETAAGVVNADCRIILRQHESQLGETVDANTQLIKGEPVFEVFGDPQVHRQRVRISHVECILRTIVG